MLFCCYFFLCFLWECYHCPDILCLGFNLKGFINFHECHYLDLYMHVRVNSPLKCISSFSARNFIVFDSFLYIILMSFNYHAQYGNNCDKNNCDLCFLIYFILLFYKHSSHCVLNDQHNINVSNY
jgi:hypothetical protein